MTHARLSGFAARPDAGPVLLVEDTPSLSMVYETVLRKAGYDVRAALTGADARAEFARGAARVVLLDLILPDADGIDLLREMTRADPGAKVIVITANGSINRAVDAMRGGAFDFLVKPFDDKRLLSAVANAAAAAGGAAEAAAAPPAGSRFHGFVGSSPAMQAVYEKVRSIGRSTATVFVTGESGSGKEVCAQAIHAVSNRASGPFVPLNCGAIPKDLLESEVFGHLRGAFTGAVADKQGAAAAADGGTLFMDEICELSLDLQAKLLRFLQTSTIQPVGAATPRKVDVRIVCATNRDPAEEVRRGRFREDLFYRLHVVPIHLPPLRERGEDVLEIAQTFLEQFSREEGKRFKRLGEEVRRLFLSHPWPGNVRQLQNAIRHVAVLHDGEEVTPAMLPPEIVSGQAPTPVDGAQGWFPATGRAPGAAAPAAPPAGPEGLRAHARAMVGARLADVEREVIEATIEACGGSVPKAARMLDVSASTLYRKREAWARARDKA
ncbi:sigma-54-dependent transcriptional regulator [Oceanicella actignis]|uniref:sigma-54-dependent transcriptional regulator n=1 Tax=Oceanicella actignis TaxID=1189325 RepID=UPI0011E7374F|nr:sigma-54 dependent transcriptional regulator [Oceanicella actignis]TYO91258.1 DNA-binding NtrC family response regulator [Oceanicella actignis]